MEMLLTGLWIIVKSVLTAGMILAPFAILMSYQNYQSRKALIARIDRMMDGRGMDAKD